MYCLIAEFRHNEALISHEFKRKAGDKITRNVAVSNRATLHFMGLEYKISLLNINISFLLHFPFHSTSKFTLKVWKRCRRHKSSPKRHVWLCKFVDQCKSLLWGVSYIEIQDYFFWADIVEFLQGNMGIESCHLKDFEDFHFVFRCIEERV